MKSTHWINLSFLIGMWSALQLPPLGVILVTLEQVKIQRFLVLGKKMACWISYPELPLWGYNWVGNILTCHTMSICWMKLNSNQQRRWIHKKTLWIIMLMEILELLDQGMRLLSMVGLPHLAIVLLICLMSIYIPRWVFILHFFNKRFICCILYA